jgi:hypothetical protein
MALGTEAATGAAPRRAIHEEGCEGLEICRDGARQRLDPFLIVGPNEGREPDLERQGWRERLHPEGLPRCPGRGPPQRHLLDQPAIRLQALSMEWGPEHSALAAVRCPVHAEHRALTAPRGQEGRAVAGKGRGGAVTIARRPSGVPVSTIGLVHRVSVKGSPDRRAYVWKEPNGSRATAKVCRSADRTRRHWIPLAPVRSAPQRCMMPTSDSSLDSTGIMPCANRCRTRKVLIARLAATY